MEVQPGPITAVDQTHVGYVRAWPVGQAEPAATLLNYGSFDLGTGALVPIASTSGPALMVKHYGGPADILVDVTGYYVQQIAAWIDLDGAMIDGSNRVLSATRLTTGTYQVTFDSDVSRCSIEVTSTVSSYYQSIGVASGATITVYNWYHSTTGGPTLTNGRFMITATC